MIFGEGHICPSYMASSYMPLIYATSYGGSNSKEPICNVGDLGSIPGLGRSPGEGNGNPLQYSCLKNSTDREACQATVHGGHCKELDMSEWLSFFICSLVSVYWNILPTFLRLLSSYKWVVRVLYYYVYKSFDEYMSHKYFLSVCLDISFYFWYHLKRKHL